MKKLLIIIAGIFVFSISLYSQTNNDNRDYSKLLSTSIIDSVPEVKIRCDEFFKILLTSDYTKAFGYILKNSPIAKSNEKIKPIIDQLKKSIDTYGELSGYEIVKMEKVTNSFIRMHYIGLNTDVPVRWIFTFYKSPKKGWIVTNIKFDDLPDLYFTD
jgi:hypothetical protein